MGITRYQDGAVTVTLDGSLEELVRRALEVAAGPPVQAMESAAQEIADSARAAWYAPGTGVRRKTGLSGDIQVVTTVSEPEVKVSVGTPDQRMVGAKPLAVIMRRPKRLALDPKMVGRDEYFSWKAAKKPVGRSGTSGASTDWTIYVPSDHASDGKNVVTELIRRPMTARAKVLTPELGKLLAAKIRGG